MGEIRMSGSTRGEWVGLRPRPLSYSTVPTESAWYDNLSMSEELSKAYDPSGIEPKWARLWVERELYRASNEDTGKPVFSIVIPPPNVTGLLHMGHMLEHT